MNILSKDNIVKVIVKIFKERFNVDFPDNSSFDMSVFGGEIKLYARDLVYIILDLEREYNIKFTEKALLTNDIYSINNMAETIRLLSTET